MTMIDLIYPKHCPVCLNALPPGKTLICAPCRKKLRLVREPVCFKCGQPLLSAEREYCTPCEKNLPAFESNTAWAEYGSFYIRRMLSEVKYHGNRQLLDYPCLDFGLKMKARVESWQAEALIPVPVHESRKEERGYNQAEEIAQRLGKIFGIPVDASCLQRSAETHQQKNLGRRERAVNLMSAFSWQGTPKKYRTVILIDDIYTTGATLNACTAVLQSAGIDKIYALCLSIGRRQ